jgi:hypothetical protein
MRLLKQSSTIVYHLSAVLYTAVGSNIPTAVLFTAHTFPSAFFLTASAYEMHGCDGLEPSVLVLLIAGWEISGGRFSPLSLFFVFLSFSTVLP